MNWEDRMMSYQEASEKATDLETRYPQLTTTLRAGDLFYWGIAVEGPTTRGFVHLVLHDADEWAEFMALMARGVAPDAR